MLRTIGIAVVLIGLAQLPASAQTASGSGCAADAATARLERQLFTVINEARTRHGVAPLAWSAASADAARCHSAEMAGAGELSHISAAGLNVGQRLERDHIRWSRVAENVAEAPSIESAQQMMMSEPPGQANHRANILDPALTRLGIGIVRAGAVLYITEDFYTPLDD
jgi:uncharacterized protein YkwD